MAKKQKKSREFVPIMRLANVDAESLLEGLEMLFRHFDVKPFTLKNRHHVEVEARWSDDDNLERLFVERHFVLSWDTGSDGIKRLFMELQRWLVVNDYDDMRQTLGRRIALTRARDGGWEEAFVDRLQSLALQLICQAADDDDIECEIEGESVDLAIEDSDASEPRNTTSGDTPSARTSNRGRS